MSFNVRPALARRHRSPTLDTPPTSPHAYDDEFESVALDAKWTRSSSPAWDDVNAIDPYAQFVTGARSSHNSYRPSWYMVQAPGAAASISAIYQPVTLAADCFVWARLSFTARFNTMSNNDGDVELALLTDVAGAPSETGKAFTFLNESGVNTVTALGGSTTSSSSHQSVGPAGGISTGIQTACYVGIQKNGTTYHSWLGWPNGNWVHLHSSVLATSLTWLWVRFTNGGTTYPGNCFAGVDFVRYRAGLHLP